MKEGAFLMLTRIRVRGKGSPSSFGCGATIAGHNRGRLMSVGRRLARAHSAAELSG